MFFVLCSRVVKVNTGATQRFAPRTSNHVSPCLSGPFEKRRTAERTATAAMSTHTCLSAEVLSDEEFVEKYNKLDSETSGYQFCRGNRQAYQQAAKRLEDAKEKVSQP